MRGYACVPLGVLGTCGAPMAFTKVKLGIVASLALVAVGAVLYRTEIPANTAALGAAIAELRDAQRLTAEWARVAGQGAMAATDGSAFDWRLLRPFGVRWQERKDALERTARDLQVPTTLANELAAYINALDARAKGVRRFAASGEAAAQGRATGWLERATTDNLGARADALVGDLDAIVESRRAAAVPYGGGAAVVAAIGLVASWMLLTARSPGHHHARRGQRTAAAPEDAAKTYAPRPPVGPRPRSTGPRRQETRNLREAMVAQLVADRLHGAAQRITAAVPQLRAAAGARLASRLDDEAHDVLAVAASLSRFTSRSAPRPELVNVAACLDEAAADAAVGGVPVSWRHAAARDGDAAVFADPAALRLMFANLLENAAFAVRLAHERPMDVGRVAVGCAIENGRVVVTVTDNGIGMSAAQRERAFFPFCSGWPDDGPAPPARMGCGLAITAKLVEACRGTIALGSPPEGGVVAQIRLPSGEWAGRPASASPAAAAQAYYGVPLTTPVAAAFGHHAGGERHGEL